MNLPTLNSLQSTKNKVASILKTLMDRSKEREELLCTRLLFASQNIMNRSKLEHSSNWLGSSAATNHEGKLERTYRIIGKTR